MKHWVIAAAVLVLFTGPLRAQTSAEPPRRGSAPMVKAPADLKANPAMWKVQGTQGVVYLFGTVHVLRPDVNWETDKIKRALHDSGELYLEIADTGPAAQAAMMPLVQSLGLDPAHPLSSKISKEDVATLNQEVQRMGAPGEEGFEQMQPWLAYLTLTVLPALNAGFDPRSGVDQVLAKQAKEQGKPVKGFETAEQQLHYLADFPQDQQVALLHDLLVNLPTSVARMNETADDWERGDVEKIAALEEGELKTKYPELYAKLLVQRNQKIADTLAQLLKDPKTGTLFVAVGAAHLAGSDSILSMLGKKGFASTREE